MAKEIYDEIGVDTDAAIETLKKIPISMHCWQGDDVLGFLFRDNALSGGIQTTGNYPGRAATVEQLRADLDVAFSLIPGKTRLNLHSIYADTDEKVDLCDLAPRHFASWIDYAKERGIGLDYNPSCFSHPMADSGFTISSADPAVRDFGVAHCAGSRGISYTIDSGYFHPTEVISDKISSVLLYTKEMLLYVSRPVRWDSDHVVILDDELNAIAASLVRTGLWERTHIGLDYFDASINRVAAWVIGTRNMQKALLRALLEPVEAWKKLENEGDYTARLALTEEHKTLPMGAVWDYYCESMGAPVRDEWLETVRKYEREVLVNR